MQLPPSGRDHTRWIIHHTVVYPLGQKEEAVLSQWGVLNQPFGHGLRRGRRFVASGMKRGTCSPFKGTERRPKAGCGTGRPTGCATVLVVVLEHILRPRQNHR